MIWRCFLSTGCSVWTYLVAQMVKNLPTIQETWVQFLGQEDPLEKGMTTHSCTLAWRIRWTEEAGRLQSMGSQRVGHNCMTNTNTHTHTHTHTHTQECKTHAVLLSILGWEVCLEDSRAQEEGSRDRLVLELMRQKGQNIAPESMKGWSLCNWGTGQGYGNDRQCWN